MDSLKDVKPFTNKDPDEYVSLPNQGNIKPENVVVKSPDELRKTITGENKGSKVDKSSHSNGNTPGDDDSVGKSVEDTSDELKEVPCHEEETTGIVQYFDDNREEEALEIESKEQRQDKTIPEIAVDETVEKCKLPENLEQHKTENYFVQNNEANHPNKTKDSEFPETCNVHVKNYIEVFDPGGSLEDVKTKNGTKNENQKDDARHDSE